MADTPPPAPPPLPTDSTPSTATKIAFTIGAVAGVLAPAALEYSPTAAAILGSVATAAIAVAGIIHVYWDHSP